MASLNVHLAREGEHVIDIDRLLVAKLEWPELLFPCTFTRLSTCLPCHYRLSCKPLDCAPLFLV